MFAGQGIGILELAQNLRLTQHHRIQARSNPHHVAHSLGIPVNIERALKLCDLKSVKARKPP